ncbi:MAG TPA: single-stranded DNA-binding protein [Armatimonadota bacterium]|jgi:single-strand DNA-binding protein
MNRIILIGRLATDPELKYTPSGVAVTDFRLAVDRPFKNASGEKETDFITIKAWREQAEFISNYFHKGRRAAVEGRLEMRNWVAQDGTKRYAAEVVADRVEFVDSPRDEDRAPREPGEAPPTYGNRPQPTGAAERPAATSASAAPSDEPDYGDPFADQ